MKWTNLNKNIYVKKGYVFTGYRKKFIISVNDLTSGSHALVNVQCDGCERELKNVRWYDYIRYIKEDGKYFCNICAINNYKKWDSFKEWCLKNNKESILELWDYELNIKSPNDISSFTSGKYYFKCPRNLHESELKNICDFTNNKNNITCKACNSFAQWGIDHLGKDFLEKYWDYNLNTFDPWKISHGKSDKKVWIKCQEKDYHESYDISPSNFISNCRCPYCKGFKINKFDSLAYIFPQVLQIWSDKNTKSPYEYMPSSGKEVYWKCLDSIHKDYKRKISNSNIYEFRCPECQYSLGEKVIEEYLIKCKIYYIPQKEFSNLVGLGNGNLSYDFYLPDYNTLIEYQGQFHDGTAYQQTKEEFKIQQEHDKRKKEYAKNNNIELLEIWYWDFDRIEEILENNLKEMK